MPAETGAQSEKKVKVLFLCTGNTARSQMAEGLLTQYGADWFEVFSAGLEPGTINPLTIKVMEEIGIDMSNHYSKDLSIFLGKVHFGYLITVCDRADQKCPIFPGMGVRMHWPFEDPAAFQGTETEKLAKFRQVRDQISQMMLDWLKELGKI
jgi:arsenate reductase (thioredoxin)